MLITELKNKDTLLSLAGGKVFIINCHGCKEIRFPEKEADELQKELVAGGHVTGIITTDYICNLENLHIRLTPGSTKADLTTSQTMQLLLRVKES